MQPPTRALPQWPALRVALDGRLFAGRRLLETVYCHGRPYVWHRNVRVSVTRAYVETWGASDKEERE